MAAMLSAASTLRAVPKMAMWEGLQMCRMAWELVKPETVRNAFKKAGVTMEDFEMYRENPADPASPYLLRIVSRLEGTERPIRLSYNLDQ